MISPSPRPIVLVTGANTGVGFGICHRLISQLTNGRQDAVSNELELECDGLTLVLACRNKQRAEAARAQLYNIADEQVRRAKSAPGYNGHAEIFRRNLRVEVHLVDLADVQSIFRFADEIVQSYPHVSHLICNAGVTCFSQIIWPRAIYQLLTNFVAAVSKAEYYIQRVGEMSQDGLGWVWQCNVFGHYVLFRALEPMLTKRAEAAPARVVWISSHEASSQRYDPKDWQLVKSTHSYQCSKYQMNMVALHLDREAIRGQLDGQPAVRHVIAYPGVVGTNISTANLGTFQVLCMYLAFYIARLLGSTIHTIDNFKAAISAIHSSFARITHQSTSSETISTVYTANTDWRGREYTGVIQAVQSQEEKDQTKELLGNCDRLLKTFCDVQGRPSPSG